MERKRKRADVARAEAVASLRAWLSSSSGQQQMADATQAARRERETLAMRSVVASDVMRSKVTI